MLVLLTGATGFIGQEILRQLLTRGHRVRAVMRSPKRSAPRPGVEFIAGDFAKDHDAATWRARLEGVDAVVNAVGIIRERSASTFDAVQRRAPIALFEACVGRDLRVVQVSAMSAGIDHPQPFLSTKGEADARLMALDLDAVVLRPSLVVGADGESARLFRGLAALPVVPIPGDGSYRFNPIHVEDVAAAAVHVLEADVFRRGVFELGGAQTLSLREMLLALRAWLGERATGPTLFVPLTLMKLPALIGDLTGLGLIDSAQLAMLQDGSVADVEPMAEAYGVRVPGLDSLLEARAATEAERWHARLAQLRVPIRLLVATIWLITPTVSLLQWDVGLELQRLSGVPEAWAPTLLLASCVLEYLVAIPLLIGRWVRLAGAFQLAMMAFFTVFLSATQSELWLDPFGSLAKNLPLIAATLAMMALADRR